MIGKLSSFLEHLEDGDYDDDGEEEVSEEEPRDVFPKSSSLGAEAWAARSELLSAVAEKRSKKAVVQRPSESLQAEGLRSLESLRSEARRLGEVVEEERLARSREREELGARAARAEESAAEALARAQRSEVALRRSEASVQREADLEAQVAGVASELASTRRERDALRRATAQRARDTVEVEGLRRRVADADASLERERARARAELAVASSGAEETRRELEAEVEALRRRLRERERRADEDERRLRRERDDAARELGDLKNRPLPPEPRLDDDAATLAAKLLGKQEQLDEARAERASLSNRLATARRQLAELARDDDEDGIKGHHKPRAARLHLPVYNTTKTTSIADKVDVTIITLLRRLRDAPRALRFLVLAYLALLQFWITAVLLFHSREDDPAFASVPPPPNGQV